jgi:hypothetical protein
MKPRLKLLNDGSIKLLKAGTSGMTEREISQFMIERSGSVHRYCTRHGLTYEMVRLALDPKSAKRNDRYGALRVVLGLPWTPVLPAIQSGYKRSQLYIDALAAIALRATA